METRNAKTKVVVGLLTLLGLLLLSLSGQAGNLEPSAPPGPTMKTLDEVEPRIPIHASDLPLIITEPNSYYLAETINFEPNDTNAITIEANDVTIDLMGYTLKGPDSGSNSGIYMNGRSNVEIRNGTIRDFGWAAIWEDTGGNSHRVINVRAMSNRRYGIFLSGNSHLVKGCTASNNGTSAAITTVYGIYAGSGSTVTGNTARDNGDYATNAGSTVSGINASSGCTVTGNTAFGNGTSAAGDVRGIYAGDGSTVTGNTARSNTDYGIYTGPWCLVDQNTAFANGTNMVTGSECVLGVNCAP